MQNNHHSRRKRIVAGFLLAPVIPCLLFSLILLPFWIYAFACSLAACYLVTALCAAPLYLYLSRRRTVGSIASTLSGFCLGALVMLAFLVATSIPDQGNSSYGVAGGTIIEHGHYTLYGYVTAVGNVMEMGFFGASIGFLFWLMALKSCRRAKALS